jgi:hypothetical protein
MKYAAKYQLKGASERSDLNRLWKLGGSYITDSIILPPHTHTQYDIIDFPQK